MGVNLEVAMRWIAVGLLAGLGLGCAKDVRGPNLPPRASAGPDRVVTVGETAHLDGGQSRDPDGILAGYAWAVVAMPDGARFALEGADGPVARLRPEAPGDYLVRLTVRDAAGAEDADVVRVRARGGCASDEECNDGLGCTLDTCLGGQCVHSPDDGLCPDDGLFCTGPARCDPAQGCLQAGDPCAQGGACADACDEEKATCFRPAGEACGDPTDAPPCDLPDRCDGDGTCDPGLAPAGTPCTDQQPGDCWRAACDGAGACDQAQGLHEAGTPCRPAGSGCDPAELCDGQGGACPADVRAPDGTPCGVEGHDECSSTCQTGVCDPGRPAEDGQACAAGAGRCCEQVCRVGWVCCQEADCGDGNLCTLDDCTGLGQCENTCAQRACFALEAPSSGPVGGPTGLLLHLCDQGLPPQGFVCSSDRNQEVLLDEDFEADYGVFATNGGDLARTAAAQSPLSAGTRGVAICGNQAWVAVNRNTTGQQDLLLRFSMRNASTGDHEMTGLYYRACTDGGAACEWRSLVLIGDNLVQPYREYLLLLPPDAEDRPEIRLSFYMSNASGGSDCVHLDDVSLVDLPPVLAADVLAEEDFEDGTLGIFTKEGGDADDAAVVDDESRVVQLKDRKNASIVTTVSTLGVEPQDLLVARFRWREKPDGVLGHGKYGFFQMSADGGTSWHQLAAIGHAFRPSVFTEYRAVLPCEARGLAELRLRFIMPSTSSAANHEGFRLDDFSLETWRMAWPDAFGPVVEQGGGLYGLTVTGGQPGTASLRCRQGCGLEARESNAESVDFQ
jgi:hypothetical protein